MVSCLTSGEEYETLIIRLSIAGLEKMGIKVCQKEGRQKYYQANAECAIFKELRGLALKTTGVADVLRGVLAPLAKRIRVAFIYGSLALGEECAASDVDILVIGNVKFADVVSVLGPVQDTLGREVNPAVYPPNEFRSKLAEGHHFLKTVMNGNRVFLIGDERELARLAGKSVAG